MKLTVAVFALSGVLLACARGFDVPEPLFEVFHPKGFRVSIPDVEGIQSVQFLLSVKSRDEEAVEMFDDPEKSEDGRWTYWDPEAVLAKDDEIFYKVTVEFDDLYWNKEGEHTVDEVFSLDGGIAHVERARGFLYGGQGNVNLFRHRNRGLISEGKKSTYHSSYSSYQSPDSKPVTRSSTSSTTGTFVMKQNGEVEASGYKKSETYDSTKREGEQWEMSESELTAEELEDLKRFIGPSFRSFSELTRGQVEEFKRLQGSNFHLPERIRSGGIPEKVHPSGVHSYEESYFKESSSTSRNQDYARHPTSSYQYHERQSAHESSTGSVQPSYQNEHPSEPLRPASSRYEQRRYNHQSTSTVAQPVALSHVSPVDDADYQQPIPVSLPSSRQTSRNYEFSRGESHRVVTANQAPARSVMDSHPSPSYLHETESERRSQSTRRYENQDDNVQAVERPKYQAESHYRGSIFRSVTTSRANNPQECEVWSETNYDHVTDLKEIQKSISKMSCLASLAENSLKEELRSLQQQNSDLTNRLESLDREFRRYKSTCQCHG